MVVIDFKNSRFESGHWGGLRQPAFIFDIRFTKNVIRRIALERYDLLIDALLPKAEACVRPQIVGQHPLLSRLAGTSMAILAAAGMPIMSGVSALQVRRQDNVHWLLGLPAVSVGILAPARAISWSARILCLLEDEREIAIESLRQELQKLLATCRPQAPSGINTPRFLQAAHDENIPWRHLADNVYQFGWGSRARWLDSSFTDKTPRISVALARDKQACAALLREAGLPVPRHRLIGSEAQALDAAKRIGYPVVVKPADLDGGRGVFVDLRDPQAVKKAYVAARGMSQRILVEQYVPGQDYRLQVHQEAVFSVIHRRPAYVVGDGVATVDALVQRTNHEREQPSADHHAEQARKPIVIDDEAHDWLQHQGLTLASIPAEGQRVRLHGAANVSTGGTREEVLHHAHPDNLALAVHAARVLRLDLAGIDLLIPDIACSWKESGAAICEVNAQPQISGHLLRPLLLNLLSGDGRIPVVVIVGSASLAGSVRESLVADLLADSIRLGWVSSQDRSSVKGNHTATSCRALMADPGIDALVWHLPAWPAPGEALPFDQVDVLVQLEPEQASAAPTRPAADAYRQLNEISLQIWRVSHEMTPDREGVTLHSLPASLAQLIKARVNTTINTPFISEPMCSAE